MYVVETRVVHVKGLDGEIVAFAEVDELHKCFFSNRKLMIGSLRLGGKYQSGGIALTAKFLGLTTFDIFLAEVNEYSLTWHEGILRMYRAGNELAADTYILTEHSFLGIGS